jgi:hypothetical protein
MRNFAILVLLSCIGLLAGCANPRSLVVGESTLADVKARIGTPTETRVDRSGDQVWDYATGPEGFETYRVRIGADGKVKEVTQLLTEDRFAKIVPGTMAKVDVKELLGAPFDETSYGAGLTWSWRLKVFGVNPGFYAVSFNPDGTVSSKSVIVDPSGGGRDD